MQEYFKCDQLTNNHYNAAFRKNNKNRNRKRLICCLITAFILTGCFNQPKIILIFAYRSLYKGSIIRWYYRGSIII